jgi:RNA polymerase subunit RPABC4/transcription elongation factor Spt4
VVFEGLMKIEFKKNRYKQGDSRAIIKKCHRCGEISESFREMKRCPSCNKSFLPSNYFGKIHAKNSEEFDELFSTAHDLTEMDIIIGLNVLW